MEFWLNWDKNKKPECGETLVLVLRNRHGVELDSAIATTSGNKTEVAQKMIELMQSHWQDFGTYGASITVEHHEK